MNTVCTETQLGTLLINDIGYSTKMIRAVYQGILYFDTTKLRAALYIILINFSPITIIQFQKKNCRKSHKNIWNDFLKMS